MKKIEAQKLAPEKSKLIIDYIIQILSKNEKTNSKMNFYQAKINGQNMCVLHISVPKDNYEKYVNLGITIDHSSILYGQLLNDLLDTFLESDTIGISEFYFIKSMLENFSGIDLVSIEDGKLKNTIKMNFITQNIDFNNTVTKYNDRYNEFKNSSSKENKYHSRNIR